jgi:hypothetical protein
VWSISANSKVGNSNNLLAYLVVDGDSSTLLSLVGDNAWLAVDLSDSTNVAAIRVLLNSGFQG